MNERKRALIFYGAVGIIFILGLIVFVIMISGNKRREPEVINAFEKFDEEKKIYDNKKKAYDDLEEQKKIKIDESNVNVDFSSFEDNNNKENFEATNYKLKEKPVTPERPKVIVKYVKEEAPAEVSKIKTYGFTELTSSNSIKDTVASKTNSTDFVPAFLEEDIKITDDARPTFILTKDHVFNGIKFKKTSILYARVIPTNTYFDIKVFQILNSDDGQKYPVSLSLYNENYARGIKYEGNVSRSFKEESNEAVQRTNVPVTSPNYYVNAVADVAKGMVNKVNRTYSISLRKNYKCYFVEEN